MTTARIIPADVLAGLAQIESESVNTCVTSPPYWGLRDYGHSNQIGLERTPEEYVHKIVGVMREVRRVLRDDGTLWLNLGDSHNGSQQTGGTNGISGNGSSQPHGGILKKAPGLKPKDLVGIPWRVAFALQADGWWLRSDIIWSKPNPMPESVTDRPTSAHEYIFLLSKKARYYYDAEAIREKPSREYWTETIGEEYMTPQNGRNDGGKLVGGGRLPSRTDKQRGHARRHTGFDDRWDTMTKEEQCSLGRNKRDVWTVATKPFTGAHFAVFNPELITPCVLAGSPVGGTVLDPFCGSGTTGIVAVENGRSFVGVELNPEYAEMSRRRIEAANLNLFATP